MSGDDEILSKIDEATKQLAAAARSYASLVFGCEVTEAISVTVSMSGEREGGPDRIKVLICLGETQEAG